MLKKAVYTAFLSLAMSKTFENLPKIAPREYTVD